MPDLHSCFSESEYDRRNQAVRQILEERHLAGVVCYGNRGAPGILPYLANFTPRWESFLFLPKKGEAVLWVQLYNHLPDARRISVIEDTRWGGADSVQELALELEKRGFQASQLGLAGPLPYQRFAALQRALPQVEWKDLSKDFVRLRLIKSDEELEIMRRAARLTDLALSALVRGVRPGMREMDLPGLMQSALLSGEGQLELCYLASTPMSEPSVCVPAQNPGARQIETGDVIITEIGAAYRGYAGQIHRPIAVGQQPTPAYQALFEVALEAYQRVCNVIHPGATGQDVLDAAEWIHREGYTIYDDLVHGFGGGYLPPILRTRRTAHGEIDPFVFQKNMCIVVQPNVITPDERMGLQLGQLHVVTDEGLASLQEYPLSFICLEGNP